jgi:pimeloyl-ACP methyl ester carboxylesterase
VLFVPGWALGRPAYQRALAHLVRLGCQVYAPALPGFGGSASLPRGNCDVAGYAAWLDAFLRQVEVDEPVVAVGHSFGGGGAAKLAHDFPDRVDGVMPRTSFESLCAELGADGRVVPGRHAWLLGDPDGFGVVMANPVAEARAARVARDGRAPGSGGAGWARPAPAADAAR